MAYRDVVLADGATHYWPLNETSGTTLADSGTGTAIAATLLSTAGTDFSVAQPGVAGTGDTAVSFTGTGQIEINSAAADPSGLAISCEVWFKTAAAGGLMSLGAAQTGGSSNMPLYVGSDGKLYFGIWNGTAIVSINSTAVVTDNAWHHAVGVMASNGNMGLYLDGASVASNSNTTAVVTGQTWWQFAKVPVVTSWPNGTTQNLTGSLSEIALYYSTALTAARILAHYMVGAGLVLVQSNTAATMKARR